MLGKPRGKNNAIPVYVYDPAAKRKIYVGSRIGRRAAEKLEREKQVEFANDDRSPRSLTANQYSVRWLEHKHGPSTQRAATSTLAVNRSMLKPFLRDFGSRRMSSIGRREALDWAQGHERAARVASAMLNDAVNDDLLTVNPFRNRQQPQSRGRRDIHPLTEKEIDQLCKIAHEVWKGYGPVCAAWIMFLAWVGCRPGECFTRTWDDLDFERGLVRVTRVKGRKQTEWIVFPKAAQEAVLNMRTPRSGLVFRSLYGKPFSKGTYGYNWKPVRVVFEAGLSPQRKDELLLMADGEYRDIDLYELRHFAGSIMADRGLNEFDIAAQLGNSPEVCRRTYVHGYRDRQMDRVGKVLNAPVVDLDAARARKAG